ncbi:hypothetical protein IMG5_011950 [Ichthyophthirius multifiliis]|uniref:NADH-ubiquinone oxidoreductase 21kDa subunit N-terminal domain-containing protein n=1 Tax=Ichthyophthirius multifiliis TaxID=5932 RepID=G0QK27_ICHMU|nr:hypothetical protein IMG5_011950 [Ichthyophthirius multifiliis]EGR34429.1 hypothetical protein IMG5_011950 [Ichthyophthirius multifiliis]|eukprot:XP_004039733.1 hypothetical protein IMG5_011950 [Ichthyophthirius multifiliis]
MYVQYNIKYCFIDAKGYVCYVGPNNKFPYVAVCDPQIINEFMCEKDHFYERDTEYSYVSRILGKNDSNNNTLVWYLLKKKQNKKMSYNTFAHDGFFGWLNNYKRKYLKFVFDVGERPPYPIINSNATFVDVVDNFNFADFGIIFTCTVLGFPFSRYACRSLNHESLYLKRYMFSTAWTAMISYGFLYAFANSYNRLNGFVDNGLRWKRKEKILIKYDFTSEYEKSSIFGFFRLREVNEQ